MNKTKTVFAAGCLAFGVVFGLLAANYDATADWDAVSSAGYADGTGDLTTAKGWAHSGGVATVESGVINVNDEEADGELAYTPSEPVAVQDRQTVEIHFPSVSAGGLSDLPDSAQAGVSAVVGEGAAASWYGWSADGWKKLTGAVPPASGGCDVRMAFSNESAKVCYSVKTGDAWNVLTPEGADSPWLPNAASAAGVGHVVFAGKTSLTDVKLSQTGTIAASGTFEARKTAKGIADADLNKTATNGNRNWENLVLNLNGADARSKPVVLPVQSGEASKVRLALGGVSVDDASASVTYTVTASDAPGGAGSTSVRMGYDESIAMDLPSSGGVKYYQMNVSVQPK